MRVRAEQLVEDLKVLRKGRGILASAINTRIGTALRLVTGTLATDDAVDVRRKVGGSLRRWAEELPEDLRVAVLVAFALDENERLPYYQDRVHLVAELLARDERTSRRRIDEGIERLAEIAAASTTEITDHEIEPGIGWYTEELRVTLALDQPTPEAFEFRRIVADRDHLGYVDMAMTLTSPPERNGTVRTDDLEVDVFHGGRLTRRAMETTDRFGFRLVLPKTLKRDESHQIGMRFRVRENKPTLPHYVCVPRQRCVDFDLRVRFNVDSLPDKIWRLNNTFQRDIDDPVPTGEPLELDPAGEIHIRFHELTPGLAYGIRWTGPTHAGQQTH